MKVLGRMDARIGMRGLEVREGAVGLMERIDMGEVYTYALDRTDRQGKVIHRPDSNESYSSIMRECCEDGDMEI